MAGFLVVSPTSADPGASLNPVARAPFWGLNSQGVTCNEDDLYYPDPWDTFFINDMQLPGMCWVENKSVAALEVEKKKGKNTSGARITILGYEPGAWDMVTRIVTPEQWGVFLDIQDKLWAGPLKATRPPQVTVKVKYPDLIRVRIFESVLIGVPLAEKSDIEGAKNFRFHFHERVPQRAHKSKSAEGPVPISPLRPDVGPVNETPTLPSKNKKNLTLSGPKLSTHGGAL